MVKIVAFCDESSVADIVELTTAHTLLCAVAFNRPKAQRMANELGVQWRIHGRKGSAEEAAILGDLTRFAPDLVFSWSYGLRIPKLILDLPVIGAINIHGGLLPEWRGANILNWVLVNGATETGVTAHWLTEGFDEGPIIARRAIAIDFLDTARTLGDKLRQLSGQLLSSILTDIETGIVLPSLPQDESKARYFKRRSPEDGRVDWEMSDLQIYNLIRALVSPWPGAFTTNESGEKVVFNELVPLEAIRSLRHKFSHVA